MRDPLTGMYFIIIVYKIYTAPYTNRRHQSYVSFTLNYEQVKRARQQYCEQNAIHITRIVYIWDGMVYTDTRFYVTVLYTMHTQYTYIHVDLLINSIYANDRTGDRENGKNSAAREHEDERMYILE